MQRSHQVIPMLAWAMAAAIASQSPAAEAEGEFTRLFNGKTHDGWAGSREWFRVEDGAIVAGRLDRKIPHNVFLTTEEEFADFELRLQFKILGKGANAGVQLRSRRIPNHHEMIGYQADLGDGWWGCLYDESRRRKVLDGPPKVDRGKPVRGGEWNEYRILCRGRRIQLWINGQPTVDYTEADDSIEQTGLIGLQIHSGPPAEAWYRDIKIKPLAPTAGNPQE